MIREARFWTIIADETMDRQKREQLAVIVRYASRCLTESGIYTKIRFQYQI